MISILLSFSFRVAGGVLRRRKSSTRVALKAHIGRLRSASFFLFMITLLIRLYVQNNHLLLRKNKAH